MLDVLLIKNMKCLDLKQCTTNTCSLEHNTEEEDVIEVIKIWVLDKFLKFHHATIEGGVRVLLEIL